jgi:nucleotide-binding universal stress UspA family protein
MYLTNGASDSIAAFPQVAGFASAIGSRTVLAHVHRQADKPPLDPRIADVLAGVPSTTPPDVVQVPARNLSRNIMSMSELAGGALALLPTRRRSVGRVLLGNTYERLIRECPLPMLTLPRDGTIGHVQRILFPADLSPRSLPAFDQAIALCRELDAELHILHVFGDDRLLPTELDLERRQAAQSPMELYSMDKQNIQQLVERAMAQGVPTISRTAEGRAHHQILTYTSANPLDMIVMPTHGPRSFEDIIRGSTTIRVVQQAPVPVLVLRG